MKYLALDYGQKRIGVAVSDAGGRMAFPRCTLTRTTRAVFFQELLELVAREQPDALVIGLPLHTDGTDCLATRQTRNFVDSLKRRLDLPIYWINEVLSSFEAEADLREVGLRLHETKGIVDQQAAVRILESFLSQDENRRIMA